MAFALSDVRSDLESVLAAAVDSSTWTTAIQDEAARQALHEYDDHVIYETSFTVISAGAEQDLSAIDGLKDIKAIAWPWVAGADFAAKAVRWRYVSDQTVYIDEQATPQSGEILRVRHTKRHTLNGLDSADSTSVPDRHRHVLVLLAAAWACLLRIRQLSENPALPRDAAATLRDAAARFRAEGERRLHHAQTPHLVRWTRLGL